MHKNITFRVKAAGEADGLEDGQFIAYASVFGNKDSYGDVVMAGAFADTLTEWAGRKAAIPLLWGHRMDDPDFNIGTVEAEEDEHGLLITGTLSLDEPKARQVYGLIKGRRVDQMSFAYDVLEGGVAQRETESGETEHYYELRKLRLYEVSVVQVGANSQTEILDVKTAGAAAAHVLAEVKAGRVLSAKNEETLRGAYAAIGEVLNSVTETGDAKNSQPSGLGDGQRADGDQPPAANQPAGEAGTPVPADEPASGDAAAEGAPPADELADLELQLALEGARYANSA